MSGRVSMLAASTTRRARQNQNSWHDRKRTAGYNQRCTINASGPRISILLPQSPTEKYIHELSTNFVSHFFRPFLPLAQVLPNQALLDLPKVPTLHGFLTFRHFMGKKLRQKLLSFHLSFSYLFLLKLSNWGHDQPQGSSLNYVTQFLGIFDPPSLLVTLMFFFSLKYLNLDTTAYAHRA